MGQADAQRQLPVQGQRGCERLLGECGGVPGVGRDYRRADLDAGDAAAGYGERGQRVETEDVRQPDGCETIIGRRSVF